MYKIFELSKYDADHINLKRIEELVYLEDKEYFINHFLFLKLKGEKYPNHFRIKLPNGRLKQIHNEYHEVQFDEFNRPVKVFGTSQDITSAESGKKMNSEILETLKATNEIIQNLLAKDESKKMMKLQKNIEDSLQMMLKEIKKLNTEVNELKKII
jgi:hypothetical protein